MKVDVNKLGFFGRIFYYSKTFRFYKDGDTYGYLWNYLNPLSYIFILIFVPIGFLVLLLAGGIPTVRESFMEDMGFTYRKYFRDNPDKIEFLT